MMDVHDIPWLEYVDPEQLNEDYNLMVRSIGLEATIKLAFAMPSIHVYFKRPELVFKDAITKHIVKHFNGANHRQLALQCRVSERFVYDVIAAQREKSRPGWKQETLL